MSLIARVPSTLSSSASESPGKRSYERQNPLSMQDEKYDRTEKPVVGRQRGAHAFQSRFSREHKHVILEEEENHDGTDKPVVCPQRGARAQQFVIGDDETELDLSLGSRPFVDRVNDQVRKRQKRSSMNVIEDSEKHSVISGMFMSSTLESSVFMGKITQTIGIPSRIQKISQ